MRVCRYSSSGFDPVYQHYMKEQVDYLTSFDEKTCGLSGHVLDMVKLGVESRLVGLNNKFSFWGIHVFFIPVRYEDVRFFLNHLDHDAPYHEKNFEDNTAATRLEDPFSSPIVTLGDLKREGRVGAYIPFNHG